MSMTWHILDTSLMQRWRIGGTSPELRERISALPIAADWTLIFMAVTYKPGG